MPCPRRHTPQGQHPTKRTKEPSPRRPWHGACLSQGTAPRSTLRAPAWGRDPPTSDLRTAPSGGPGANEGLEGVGLEPEDPAQPDLDCPVPPRTPQWASASRPPDMSSLQALCSGLPLRPLPENRGRRAGLPHAPVRTPGLSPAEEQVRGRAPSCRAVCPLGGPAGQCPRPALSRVCQTASHPISLILCPVAALGGRSPAPIY